MHKLKLQTSQDCQKQTNDGCTLLRLAVCELVSHTRSCGLAAMLLAAALLAKEIAVPALGPRGDGCLNRLAGTGEAASRGNPGAPFQAHLVALAPEALLRARQAMGPSPVTLKPLRLARPAAVMVAIARGRHAAKRRPRKESSATGAQPRSESRDGPVIL